MKIGFSFFGITFGSGGRTGSDRNVLHCWPNLKSMLVDPFVEQGHKASIYFTTYPLPKDKEVAFYDTIKPDGVHFCEFEGSDPFTCKYAAFDSFRYEELDVIVFTRSDIHFSRVIANEKVDLSKFNFLFREQGWWATHRFACDNLYIFPKSMSLAVESAIEDTYAIPRGKPYVDTHNLPNTLAQYLSEEQINFISDDNELSDVNSFYTCCRSGLPEDGRGHMHPEVRERFYR